MSSIQGRATPVTTTSQATTIPRTPVQPPEATPQGIAQTRVSPTRASTAAVLQEGYETSSGNVLANDSTPLSSGEAVSAELLAQLGVLAQKAKVPGANRAEAGDVDIAVADNFAGVSFASTQGAMTALATAYPSLSEAGQNQTADFINGFVTAADAAQSYVAQEQLGISPDALRQQLAPTLEGIGQLTSSSGAMNASTFVGTPSGTTQVNENFSSFLDKLPTDPNALVQWVLRESYLESSQDLRMYAEKVKFYNACKQQIRAELKRARDVASGMAGQADTASLPQVFQPATINTEFYGQQTPDVSSANAALTADSSAPAAPSYPKNSEVVGWYTSGQKSMDDLVSMYQNGEISAANLTAVRNHLMSQYQASGKTKSVSNKQDESYAVGHKLKADALATDLSARGTEYVHSFMAWFNGLSQTEQQAVIKQLQTKGVTVSASGSEGGITPHSGASGSGTAKLSGTDVESYISNLVDQAVTGVKNDMDSWYGGILEGNKLEHVKLNINMTLPTATYTQLGAKPADLKTVDAALNTPDASSAGMSSGNDGVIDTKSKLNTYIKNMEDKLNSVGDDAQLANVDLQNMLQKQQQTLQMMSNISKMLNDTAMAIIRKIGG